MGLAVARVDLGGGLGIRYRDEHPPEPSSYARLAREIFGSAGLAIAFEPGRVLAGPAGLLVARVIYVKEGAAKRFVIVDAAMNDLIRPALYDAWHDIVPVRLPALDAVLAPADVVGPVCETGDTFAVDRDLPPLAEGDLVAFTAAGAYGAVMSSTYNSRLLVPEVLVAGDRFAVIRARPSYDDMLSLDTIPAWLSEAAPELAETRCRMTDRPSEPDRPVLDRGCASPVPRCCGSGCGPPAGRRSACSELFSSSRLFDLLPLLPGLVHAALLLGFGAAFVAAFAATTAGIVFPDRFAARRRIEQASGLEHRPLQALADRPSTPLDSQAARLWQAHRRRMEAATRRLRIGLPAAGLAGRDPWGLRAVLAMLLLIGAVDAGADWRDRLGARPDAGLAGRISGCCRKPRHLGHAPRIHRIAAAVSAGGYLGNDPYPDRKRAVGPGAWRRRGAASGDRR